MDSTNSRTETDREPPRGSQNSPAEPATREPDPRSQRAPLAAIIGLVALCTLSLFWLLPGFYDPSISTGDGAVYIVTARNLMQGEGYSYLGEAFTIRPPGFSWMLVPLLWIFGVDYSALAWCIGLFGVLTVALLYLYVRPSLGTPLALAVALTLWLNPGFLRSCSQIMSDVPGMALLFGGLLFERWARRRPTPAASLRANLLLGLFIGFAAYVRSLNIFLVPALILGRIFAARRDGLDGQSLFGFTLVKLVLPAAVVLGCLLPWSRYSSSVISDAPPEHTLFHSYSVAMWHQDIADPESPLITREQFFERVAERTWDLLHVLGSRVQDRSANPTHRMIAIIALSVWAVVLLVRRETLEFLAGGIVLVIAIYFGFMNRLIIPVYALLLPAIAYALSCSLGRVVGARTGPWLASAALLALAAVDFNPHWRWDQTRTRSELFFKTCRAVERQFTAEDVLAADFGAHFSAELDRPVFTLRWALKRGGVPAAVDFIERHGVTALVLDRSIPKDLHLADELVKQGAQVSAQVGAFALLRL